MSKIQNSTSFIVSALHETTVFLTAQQKQEIALQRKLNRWRQRVDALSERLERDLAALRRLEASHGR